MISPLAQSGNCSALRYPPAPLLTRRSPSSYSVLMPPPLMPSGQKLKFSSFMFFSSQQPEAESEPKSATFPKVYLHHSDIRFSFCENLLFMQILCHIGFSWSKCYVYAYENARIIWEFIRMMLSYGKSYSSSPKLFFPLDSFVQSDFYVKVEKFEIRTNFWLVGYRRSLAYCRFRW